MEENQRGQGLSGTHSEKESGLGHIATTFERTRAEGRAALIIYLTLGFPTPEKSIALVEAAVAGGADLLELGVPFSDPLADGPIIQRAAQIALQQGMTVDRCLDIAKSLRERKIKVPLIFMGYYNPILAYDEDAFCRACQNVGADGIIVPDLPPEEGGVLERTCKAYELALVYLLAPTSTPDRVRLVTGRSQGFVYLVSVAGITGPRDRLPADLEAFVTRVRQATAQPLAVGFGISTPEQARQVAVVADGVVVGSALVRLGEASDGVERVKSLVRELRQAMVSPPRSEKRLPDPRSPISPNS